MPKESQQQKILSLLEKGDWVCTSQMYALFIADPRTLICKMKKQGIKLESRKCQQHNFHEGFSKEWRLVSISNTLPVQEPKREQSTLFEIQKRKFIYG